jgi:hypothetical protein
METLAERADLTPDLKQGCKAYLVQLQKRITVKPYIKVEDYAPVCQILRFREEKLISRTLGLRSLPLPLVPRFPPLVLPKPPLKSLLSSLPLARL